MLAVLLARFQIFLVKKFPDAEVLGVEFLDALRNKASYDFPHIKFLSGDVTKKDSVSQKFDIITMLGVLSIFDDYNSVIANVLSWLRPRGKLILQNMISDYEIDVFIKYCKSDSYHKKNLESGWNIISKKSLSLAALKNNSELISCEDFFFGIDAFEK